MSRRARPEQDGFTILELMIATSILSVILLIVTGLMIGIGNLYYKGVSQARVQDSVRSISDNLSEQLQLNTASIFPANVKTVGWGGVPVYVKAYCIGNVRYSYVLGIQSGTGTDTDGTLQMPHVLWRDTNLSGDCRPLDLRKADPTADANSGGATNSADGTELLPPSSRLTAFCVGTLNNNSSANPKFPDYGNCTPVSTSPYSITVGIAYGNIDLLTGSVDKNTFQVGCKGTIGDQFCATSELTTQVVQRL